MIMVIECEWLPNTMLDDRESAKAMYHAIMTFDPFQAL